MQKTQKGFTIIELIVVIAIIAVLATIVAINVTSYIAKGKDASIKGNMANIQTVAATVFDASGTSGVLSTAPGYVSAKAAIEDANGTQTIVENVSTISAWCIETVLNDSTTWCVDSTGYKGSAAGCSTTVKACN